MQVKDYPGLLRVIAWVINGLDLLVENAKCAPELALHRHAGYCTYDPITCIGDDHMWMPNRYLEAGVAWTAKTLLFMHVGRRAVKGAARY